MGSREKFSTPPRKSQTFKDTPQTSKVWVAPMNQSSSEREKWQKPKQTKHYNPP
ncbi:asl8049 (plasmid) [Nostoc sp. PCC 7120 = FACHB-418]|nr:asl8049 [Nostoc sp. PCC 7120 = FACHB-418]